MSVVGSAAEILMQVPAKYQGQLASGALKLTGSVLRNSKTGQIVGFLQEAAPMSRIVGAAGKGALGKFASVTIGSGNPALGAVAGTADMAMQVGQLAQGEAIRSGVGRIEGGVERIEQQLGVMDEALNTLQGLGAANLAVSAAGIGVSLIGFGIMAMKLDRVQASLHSISDQLCSISAKLDQLRQDAVDRDFIEIQTLCRLYDEGWDFGDRGRSEQQWLRIAHEARGIQDRFGARVTALLSVPVKNFELADQMLDAMALISGLRVSAMLACNEGALASSINAEASQQIETLTGAVGLVDLALPTMSSGTAIGSAGYNLALVRAREEARPLLQKFRQREAAIGTRTAPLPHLERIGCAPREWMEEARSEQNQPILMLPT